MKTKPVKFEFSTKVFETIDQLLLDVECKNYTSKLISEIKRNRSIRPLPPPGMRYVRGAYEQLAESNRLTSDFMLAEYPALVAKKSILSSTIRLFIGEVISKSLQKTYNHYRITLEKGSVITGNSLLSWVKVHSIDIEARIIIVKIKVKRLPEIKTEEWDLDSVIENFKSGVYFLKSNNPVKEKVNEKQLTN